MSRHGFAICLGLVAFASAPAFAQSDTPMQGTVQPRHVTHPPPAHKMPAAGAVDPDKSADMLNAKELAAIQHGTPAEAPMQEPAAAPPKP